MVRGKMVSKEEIIKRVTRDMKMKGLYKDGKKEDKKKQNK